MDNFFSRSGTMNKTMDFANALSGMKSNSATGRISALGQLVQMVMSLLA